MDVRRVWRKPVVWVGVGVFVVAAAIGLSAQAGSWGGAPVMSDVAVVASARATATASPTQTAAPAPAPAAAPAVGPAAELLATLPVKGRAPKTGYDRPVVFGPAWKDVDRNGCDTRNDILRRDLTAVVDKPGTHGCVVASGTLADPYTGTSIAFVRGNKTSTAVQIDHVVALMDAWQTGAQRLSQTQREQLANDPLNLLAVDGPTNERKSAGDAATWLPPNTAVRCAYVARQVTVKAKYGLWVTGAEHDAIARILDSCPGQLTATAGTLAASDATSTAPVAPVAPAPVAPSVVHPGAFCAPAGAQGVTVKGTPMACSSVNGDRARWRRAG